MPNELVVLLLFGLGGWYWLAAMSAKEYAHQVSSNACKQAQLNFLDDSVVLKKIRLRRDTEGRIMIYRWYEFEFTSDGSERYKGDVRLLGQRVLEVRLDSHRMPEQWKSM